MRKSQLRKYYGMIRSRTNRENNNLGYSFVFTVILFMFTCKYYIRFFPIEIVTHCILI